MEPRRPPPRSALSSSDLSGKEKNKQALRSTWHLPYRPEVPAFGLVFRLVWQ
ncbi:MAG: hypothetical protein IT383_18170 [Deltaproteobacteria bacterium]|nr:hypothetical protein [Deltaproteobacteria bacterium]